LRHHQRRNVVQRSCSNRNSRDELLSTSKAHWSTTKFDGMWEIAPWGLRVPRQARLATGQAQRGPQRERDRHAHVSPAFRCSHHRLPTHPLTRVVALDDVLRRARRAPSPGVVCPTSAQAPRASALAHPWLACTNAASGERADAGRESTNHATLRLTRRAPTRGPQHHLTMPHRRCPPGWVLLFCRT